MTGDTWRPMAEPTLTWKQYEMGRSALIDLLLAYPLLPWLMKPYTAMCRLTREQRHYNYQHSRARMVIENTFGRCKATWRTLHQRIDVATEDVTTVILACFTLNNICEVHKETFDAEWLNADGDVPPPPPTPVHPQDVNNARNAMGIRQALSITSLHQFHVLVDNIVLRISIY